MPSQQERPPKQVERLEAEGPAPQPLAPAAPLSATTDALGSASAAAPLLSHWTESGSDPEGAAQHPQDRSAAMEGGGAGSNPLAGKGLYVTPNTNAGRQAAAWRTSRPDDAAQLDKIANSPQSTWLGDWNQNIESDVGKQVAAAKVQGTTPVFVAYNIPNRDVGQYSAGGASGAALYRDWIAKVAAGVKGGPAVVILEPDALAQADRLPPQQREERYAMLREAVATLKKAGATVYLDAGNPEWKEPADMGQRLKSAGVEGADGFALNVSNFFTTQANIAYGTALSAQTGGKHFVIDASRNGLGPAPDREWCNPAGRALGQRPTTQTGHPLVDAFLWVKHPGESDGNARGAPPAGTFWPEYALDLARREPVHGGTPSAASSTPAAGTAATTGSGTLRDRNLNLSLLPPGAGR